MSTARSRRDANCLRCGRRENEAYCAFCLRARATVRSTTGIVILILVIALVAAVVIAVWSNGKLNHNF